ncbi:MAG: S8 family serine peptidase, partial [Ruminiclostridium sp.]|nr:S8 family serine peptidase [Ruminiclostridium sp.]
IITMKVFGKGGGAYDSDYMLAIEDAIILGADSINLSLGSANGGASKHATAEYQKILDDLSACGAVVSISAGNSGHWAANAFTQGYLYADDVNTQTDGSPGSFTNAFTVASAENIGAYSVYFTSGGYPIVYTESTEGNDGTPYTNKPFATLKGELEYVLIDGFGTPEDWAAVGDALKGKVAVCSRGSINFADKCTNAINAGAIATIIYNNTTGVIRMDLSDYKKDAPAVTITQAEGRILKANAVHSEDGTYYTGTIVNKDEPEAVITTSRDHSTVSDFSSWGVPGSLELKPEITAPGGNIYSVNGATAETDQYITMDGTSMAAPQVAGMAAVAAQYIREKGLDKKTGLSARTLAQSLIMSTATPMFDYANRGYYSLLQQGAGLANIGSVVTAESYILMDENANAGAKDGKVKVELGDDPARKGVYSFGFTLYNLTDTEKKYELSAEFFMQGLTLDGGAFNLYGENDVLMTPNTMLL